VLLVVCGSDGLRDLPSFPTRRSSDLLYGRLHQALGALPADRLDADADLHGGLGGRLADRGQLVVPRGRLAGGAEADLLEALRERSEEHTSELQSRENLVCRLLLEKKK